MLEVWFRRLSFRKWVIFRFKVLIFQGVFFQRVKSTTTSCVTGLRVASCWIQDEPAKLAEETHWHGTYTASTTLFRAEAG